MKFNIGIIDDDIINNVQLAEIFSQLEYNNCHWFQSPEQCYEMLESGLNLDLILINWNYEQHNIENSFSSKLRIRGINCPIIFIIRNYTSQAEEKILEFETLKTNIYKYGAINVLIKPYDVSSVFCKIESAKKIARNRQRAIREKSKVNSKIFDIRKAQTN